VRDLIINLIGVGACLVIAYMFPYHACYTPTQYTPIEQAARTWGHKHLGDRVSVICEGSTCMVWATYYSGRSSHTSPPVLLDCAAECVPDLRGSVATPAANL
jgi:hypothetical protein